VPFRCVSAGFPGFPRLVMPRFSVPSSYVATAFSAGGYAHSEEPLSVSGSLFPALPACLCVCFSVRVVVGSRVLGAGCNVVSERERERYESNGLTVGGVVLWRCGVAQRWPLLGAAPVGACVFTFFVCRYWVRVRQYGAELAAVV
jgi:hypothetical protein